MITSIIAWLNKQAANKDCPHSWKYIGHGHNYSTYKCEYCNEEVDY